MEWGKHASKLRKHNERLKAKGKSIKALDNIPVLDEDVGFVWQMWNNLHRTRYPSPQVAPIPFSEAAAYLGVYCPDYTADDTNQVLELFFVLEEAWLVYQRGKINGNNKIE